MNWNTVIWNILCFELCSNSNKYTNHINKNYYAIFSYMMTILWLNSLSIVRDNVQCNPGARSIRTEWLCEHWLCHAIWNQTRILGMHGLRMRYHKPQATRFVSNIIVMLDPSSYLAILFIFQNTRIWGNLTLNCSIELLSSSIRVSPS